MGGTQGVAQRRQRGGGRAEQLKQVAATRLQSSRQIVQRGAQVALAVRAHARKTPAGGGLRGVAKHRQQPQPKLCGLQAGQRQSWVVCQTQIVTEPVDQRAHDLLALASPRQRSEQYLTFSQSRAHFFRQAKGLPQVRQILLGNSDFFRIFMGTGFNQNPS